MLLFGGMSDVAIWKCSEERAQCSSNTASKVSMCPRRFYPISQAITPRPSRFRRKWRWMRWQDIIPIPKRFRARWRRMRSNRILTSPHDRRRMCGRRVQCYGCLLNIGKQFYGSRKTLSGAPFRPGGQTSSSPRLLNMTQARDRRVLRRRAAASLADRPR